MSRTIVQSGNQQLRGGKWKISPHTSMYNDHLHDKCAAVGIESGTDWLLRDGTWQGVAGEVKGKQENGVDIQ